MLGVVLTLVFHMDRSDFFIKMVEAGILVNSAMMVFNLIPLPPLDGGRIVTGILPLALARKYAQIERYGIYVFIALILLMQFGFLTGFLISGMQVVGSIFRVLVSPLFYLFA